MGIFRVKKSENFTVMSNYHLKDRNLSLKSQGLLSLILSLPDDWDYSVNGLVSIVKDGKSAVQSALKELEARDYIIRRKIKNEKGQIVDWEYLIFEDPRENNISEEYKKSITISPLSENQDMGNQDMGNQDMGNQSQLNTKEQNTNKINTKQKSTGAGAHSKNHSNVYKKRNVLEDTLESGKDIDEQKKASKKSPAEKLRDECFNIIDKEYSDDTKDLLIEYFEFVSAVPENKDNLCKRVKTVKQWRHKLDRLDELAKEGYDYKKLIQQSLDKKYYVFCPLESVQKTSKVKETLSNKLVMSDPEYMRKRLEEDESEEWY